MTGAQFDLMRPGIAWVPTFCRLPLSGWHLTFAACFRAGFLILQCGWVKVSLGGSGADGMLESV